MKIIYDIPEFDDFDGDDENIKLKLYEEDKEYENDWEFNISLNQDKNCCGIISLGNFFALYQNILHLPKFLTQK